MYGMKFAFALALLAPLYAQDADAKLIIAGDVTNPLTLTKADLASCPAPPSPLKAEGGAHNHYEGSPSLRRSEGSGRAAWKQLMGKALASYVLAEARDGYQVVYTLTELDPSFTDNKIIVADTDQRQTSLPISGPFRLVVPGEKKGARSIRMLEKITVVRLRK